MATLQHGGKTSRASATTAIDAPARFACRSCIIPQGRAWRLFAFATIFRLLSGWSEAGSAALAPDQPDRSFARSGVAKLSLRNPYIGGVAVDPQTGEAVTGGAFCPKGSEDGCGFFTARYSTTGALVSFRQYPSDEFLLGLGKLALQGDGKALLGGTYVESLSPTRFSSVVARFSRTGALDAGFGVGGIVRISEEPATMGAYALGLQSDGRIVVASAMRSDPETPGSRLRVAVHRVLPGGAVDPSFRRVLDLGDADYFPADLAVQHDDKIVLAVGEAQFGGSGLIVVRMTASGALDGGFGSGGIAVLPTSFGPPTAIACAPDGGIVVAGGSSSSKTVVRLRPNGSLDTSFGAGGRASFLGAGGGFTDVAIQSDGSPLLVGPRSKSGAAYAVRLTPQGQVDARFKARSLPFDVPAAVGIQADGRVLTAGSTQSAVVVSRLLGDGCGDAIVQPPEDCDDGNLNDDDGCDSACNVETPGVEIMIDRNLDGRFDAGDQTHPDEPFVFWVNDDDDTTFALADLLAWVNVVQLAIPPLGVPVALPPVKVGKLTSYLTDHGRDRVPDGPSFTPDVTDRRIDHARDLEDFFPVRVELNAAAKAALSAGASLSIEAEPGINLYPAAGSGRSYIDSSGTAAKQALKLAESVDPEHIEVAFERDLKKGGPGALPMIAEAVGDGVGVVRLVLRDGSSGATMAESSQYVEFRRMSDLYELVEATVGGVIDEGYSPDLLTPPQFDRECTQGLFPALGFNVKPAAARLAAPGGETLVYVHGCCVDRSTALLQTETLFKRFWWAGFRGHFVAIRWPALGGFPPSTYNLQEFRALKFGAAFRAALGQLRGREQGRILLLAHSLGNMLAGEALRESPEALIDGYVLSQAASAAGSYDTSPSLLDGKHPYFDVLCGLREGPYFASEFGGAEGYFSKLRRAAGVGGVLGPIVALSNPDDRPMVDWMINNLSARPDPAGYQYAGGVTSRLVGFEGGATTCEVTDRHEAMAFAGCAHTLPVGAELRVSGQIDSVVDLKKKLRFGEFYQDHGGQFDRAIQDVLDYYRLVLAAFGSGG